MHPYYYDKQNRWHASLSDTQNQNENFESYTAVQANQLDNQFNRTLIKFLDCDMSINNCNKSPTLSKALDKFDDNININHITSITIKPVSKIMQRLLVSLKNNWTRSSTTAEKQRVYLGRLTDRAMHRTPQNRRGCIIFDIQMLWFKKIVLAENGLWYEIATQGHSRHSFCNQLPADKG